ncbi:polysaccharide deacetylase family protein [Actinoplanes awajinensis]|uniref:Polysaccharide deacetylase n=1 Tax=Actinoplanes awajinensis subsp. mycoplanecinus TaxID=135947 RepID=A0A101JH42_9ACTN|nr:polysaccharide deacetylase family protein [Actinoplanes awajinensis]KUL26701.1 polysaccharide deacetylase [Actinoplanes awajinensis subsp. mycoplanecinus]
MLNRRAFLRTALAGTAGVAVGAAGMKEIPHWLGLDRPPVAGGYAAGADVLDAVRHPGVAVRYYVETTEPVVAFTFDDGPAPRWTPMVLDALDAANVPATFFMVGQNLAKNADLVRGRMDRHEIGNHTWAHDDLATLDLNGVTKTLKRTEDEIHQQFGRPVTLLRPPFGHIGGSTMLAADSLGYDVVLWSKAMREKMFAGNPEGQAKDIVDAVRPGSILLAHDEGDDRRLVTIKGLATMFAGLRDRGFRMVTVSDMIATGKKHSTT